MSPIERPRTTHRQWLRPLVAAALLLMLSACTTFGGGGGGEGGVDITGTWTSELAGYPVTVTYAEETMYVEGHEPVAYEINNSELTIAAEGATPLMVSFPSEGEMVQEDQLTGVKRHFRRIK